jgi:hypothetical protein
MSPDLHHQPLHRIEKKGTQSCPPISTISMINDSIVSLCRDLPSFAYSMPDIVSGHLQVWIWIFSKYILGEHTSLAVFTKAFSFFFLI